MPFRSPFSSPIAHTNPSAPRGASPVTSAFGPSPMTPIQSSLQAMMTSGPRADALTVVNPPVGPRGRKPLENPQWESQQGYNVGFVYGADVLQRAGHMVLTLVAPFVGDAQRWFNGFVQGAMDAGSFLATQGALSFDTKNPNAPNLILVHLWPMTVAEQQQIAAAAKAGQLWAPSSKFTDWPLIAPAPWNPGFGGI